ncbi:MAG: 50S ribosomal protein L15 [Pseudomonadales bacterium]|nr:50S ribosomal protein L15 [Pseudomonadales bacterium]
MSDDTMRLNTITAAPGHRHAPKRVGRGIGSGLGKTAGRGHKGQRARKSGNVRPGFEGGQMPLQQRLPKYGFTSRIARVTAQLRTSELNKVEAGVVDLDTLKAANVIARNIERVRVFASGAVDKALSLKGIAVTRGARAAIEAAGGKVED